MRVRSERKTDLTLAFVEIFQSMAATRGLLSALGDQETVSLLDDAALRVRLAMHRRRQGAPDGRGRDAEKGEG